jgi:hypothetical protein
MVTMLTVLATARLWATAHAAVGIEAGQLDWMAPIAAGVADLEP